MEAVTSEEILTRYILEKAHFSVDNNRVKYSAFLPNPTNGETSVFRISGVSERDVWGMGTEYVAKEREKTLKARGDVIAIKVLNKKLNVTPDTETHPRHANITGWPQDKSERLLLAKELENDFRLVVCDQY